MSKPNHRLPTKLEKFDESYKKFIVSTQAALDEATDSGDSVRAEKIAGLKQNVSEGFKELRTLIQREPEDKPPAKITYDLENNSSQSNVEKLRSRFRRWLGQICRDEHYTILLDSNYNSWMFDVRSSADLPINVLKITTDRQSIKEIWTTALDRASLEQLQRLDLIIVNEKLDKN